MHLESKISLTAPPENSGDYMTSMVFLKDQRLIASTTRLSRVTLWDIADGRPVQSLQGRSESWKIAVSSDEKFLAIASDRGVQICNISAGAALQDLESRLSSTSTLSFHPELSMLAYGTRQHGKFVEIRNLDESEIVAQIGHSYGVDIVSFSPDGNVLATYSGGELFFWLIWGPITLDFSHRFVSQPKQIAFSRDWRFIAAAESNAIGVWELESGFNDSHRNLHLRKLKELPLAVHRPFTSLAFSPDGAILAVGGDPLWLVDLIDDTVTKVVNTDFTTGEIVFSHDGSMLAVCGGMRGSDQECVIKLWSLSR